MYNKHKLSTISTAISLALIISPSISAEELEKKKEKEEIEVIEVTGFKGSLLRSLNEKRFSDAISDSIFSEDIGKSADQDIGQALQRVTGVSIQNDGSSGSTTVTVRGAGPNLNNISLNGINLTSSTESQAVDLSAFSSDILNSIVVMKTSAADQNEGSLGANIELKTFRPLDGKDKSLLEVQGRYDDYAEENDFKISGSFSKKFLDESLGFYITAFKETQSTRRDQFNTEKLKTFNSPNAIDSRTGEETGAVTGYVHGQNGFTLFQNSMEREGFTTALQWAVSDETELNFNATLSDQYLDTNNNNIIAMGSTKAYADVDLHHLTNTSNPWLVYDSLSQAFIKKVDRSTRGRTQSLRSGVETKNTIYNLSLSHYFTDNFAMELRGGYSKTTANDDHYSKFYTSNIVHVPDEVLAAVDTNAIQPTGYDCTSGPCYIVTGTGMVDFGPDIDGVPQTGAPTEPTEDNLALTAYNPDDINSIHLNGATTRDRDMSDTQKSFYADFDWQVDFGPITSFEFGGKYEKRDKDVWNQNYSWNGTPTPANGGGLGVAIRSIQLSQVTDGETPYGDDFLAELGYGRTNTTDGWWTLNPEEALSLIFANDDIIGRQNLANDREVSLENKALYFKTNFAFFDEKLTGNVGIRYVESGVDGLGYSGVRYQLTDVADRDLVAIATDTSLAACTEEQLASPAGGFDDNGVWGAIESQSCFDAAYNTNATTRSRYLDGGRPENPDQFPSSATNKTTNWLPSLTLNYALNDDMVLRFAASKTMSRPRIDSLRPSYNIRENVWGNGDSVGAISNPYLEPLESKNLDLSYEWYFNEGGALSVALFSKDMTNFEESATISTHWADLRGYSTDQLTPLDPFSDILIEKPGGESLNYEDAQAAGINCMLDSRHKWQDISLAGAENCDTMNVTSLRNGKGGTNRGVELGYNQNFDFLPDIWGGLGVAVNYTYSDSETEAEDGPLGSKLAALPMENVSKHVYNVSTFWEQDGNLIRLAYNHRSDSLRNRGYSKGALWNDGGGQLDLSANYKVNDNITVTFNAVNLNKKTYRTYYTNLQDSNFAIEGNALDGKANKSRTIQQWTSGTVYRLGVRATF